MDCNLPPDVWLNYVPDDVKEIWPTFTEEQKQVLARHFEELAINEEWD